MLAQLVEKSSSVDQFPLVRAGAPSGLPFSPTSSTSNAKATERTRKLIQSLWHPKHFSMLKTHVMGTKMRCSIYITEYTQILKRISVRNIESAKYFRIQGVPDIVKGQIVLFQYPDSSSWSTRHHLEFLEIDELPRVNLPSIFIHQ